MTFKVTIILSMFKNLYSELILKSTICNQVVEKTMYQPGIMKKIGINIM